MPRITHFAVLCMYSGVSCPFRLCGSDFGITPVDDITIRITCAAFCFHTAHISFASSWYLFCSSVIVLARLCVIWDSCVCQKGFLCFLLHKSYVRSIKIYCSVRKYAVISVQLEIFILQYIGWCVLVTRTFIINQFSCFCQFLMDNFG